MFKVILPFIFSLLIINQSVLCQCGMASMGNPDNNEAASIIGGVPTSVGQSITIPAACVAGTMSQITVVIPSSVPDDIELRLYSGAGYGGALISTNTILGPFSAGINTLTFTSRAIAANEMYSFRFDCVDAGGGCAVPFQTVATVITNPYTGGDLLLGNTPTAATTRDILFAVNTPLLPVELAAFDARTQNQKTLLTWTTASELNNAGWDIERSANGQRWETIAFVNGSGTTTSHVDYQYIDHQPLAGQNYYRLRQIDFDGASDYSPVRVVNFGDIGGGVTVSPNPVPAGDVLTVAGLGENTEAVMLVDMYGRPVWESAQIENGQLRISLPNDLPKGMYSVVVFSEGKKTVKRVAVQ